MSHVRAVAELVAALNRHPIRYCHWKSNQHLGEALAGETDLDILVDGAQADACRSILRQAGCKQVVPQPSSRYPGIEDWLVFDGATGRLGHIHLHFRIITGGRPKNYHLPIEQWLLSECVTLFDVAIPAYARELIVLAVRTALKARFRDLAKALLRPYREVIPAAARAEFDWLLGRVDAENIGRHLQASGLRLDERLMAGFFRRYSAGRVTPAYFLGFKVRLTRSLKNCCTASVVNRARFTAAARLKNVRGHGQKKKTLPDRGVFFALVGADGSGKTTLARDLAAWLGWKLEVRVLYFGIPKSAGPYIFFTKARQRADMLSANCIRRGIGPAARFFGFCSRTLDALLWAYVARQRYAQSRSAQSFRSKGCVVIGERFPLRQFNAMEEPMDGARLQKQPGGLLARLERFFYARLAPPDRMIVLQAAAEVLNARKPAASLRRLQEKVCAVNSIRADATAVTVDAEGPYASVALAVKTAVWEML